MKTGQGRGGLAHMQQTNKDRASRPKNGETVNFQIYAFFCNFSSD